MNTRRWKVREVSAENKRRIIETYQNRTEAPRYSRRVRMDEIKKNDFNLNIWPRYISTAVGEAEIDLEATNADLVEIEKAIQAATTKHNKFLEEFGLPLLPGTEPENKKPRPR